MVNFGNAEKKNYNNCRSIDIVLNRNVMFIFIFFISVEEPIEHVEVVPD